MEVQKQEEHLFQEQKTEARQQEKRLQWHPAFFAGIQIELESEAENLIFENEHQLGTRPMEIDVLIIKKRGEMPIHKNIGQIFRKYNLIEYKGPSDYLSLDDFYKVYGYCCFYKADTEKVDSIKVNELSISLVSVTYPRKLIRHLREKRGYGIVQKEKGIYEITGDEIAIQIIVTGQLSRRENLWLSSLTNQLAGAEEAKELLEEYRKHKKSNLYESVMNIVMRANMKKFEEVQGHMCDALMELMKDELKAEKSEGEGIGVKRVNDLNLKLSALDRTEDIIKAASDSEYQNQLFREFNL